MKRIQLFLLALLLGVAASASAQSNIAGTLFSSAARTITTSSADITNTSTRGAHIYINVSVYVSGIWTPIVQGKDPVTNNYYTICTGPSITATGATLVRVYPGAMAQVADEPTCNDFLPRTWRLQMLGASTPSATFSAGYLGEF